MAEGIHQKAKSVIAILLEDVSADLRAAGDPVPEFQKLPDAVGDLRSDDSRLFQSGWTQSHRRGSPRSQRFNLASRSAQVYQPRRERLSEVHGRTVVV
jgi:hypothetical protein